MSHKLYLYPKWIRLWHATNALMFIILIITGISMQYTDKETNYFIIRFDRAILLHNFAALIITISYILFVTGNVLTKNGKQYRIDWKKIWKELFIQFKFYSYGMFKSEPHPFPVTEERKFNPLQQFVYVLAMYIGMPLLIVSGVGLLFPEITIKGIFGISGLLLTDVLHITMGFFLSIFMIIHLYTCTLGSKPTTLFKGMITGYHEADEH
ncbi:MAG: cytochrome b/b6 domain-containing protein [Bacteroidales bacterium]|nr:cytochrome b/b6 domain-containing protein [Bacteroidales bacterium]